MVSTRLVVQIQAPRATVYRALLDAHAVSTWMVPTGMTSKVHVFEPRVGGKFRISLTYDAPELGTGKSNAQTDTFHGRFLALDQDTRVVQGIEFETDQPEMRGEMVVTYTLADKDGGTQLTAVHDGVPPGVSPADNELGWTLSLGKLAALVEGR